MKLREIERLRAVAILMVMALHWDCVGMFLPEVAKHSWSGVDLFFVISGYVVTLSLVRMLPPLEDAGQREPYPKCSIASQRRSRRDSRRDRAVSVIGRRILGNGANAMIKPTIAVLSTLAVLAASAVSVNAEAKSWHVLTATCATSISASDGTVPWATGCMGGDSLGNPILYTNNYNLSTGANTWQAVNGTAISIAAAYQTGQSGNNLYVWIAQTNGNYLQGLSTSSTHVTWLQEDYSLLPAAQISVNAATVKTASHATAGTSAGLFYDILSNGNYSTWPSSSGSSFSVSTDNQDYWAVGSGEVFHASSNHGAWTDIHGCATWVAGATGSGSAGTAYAVGCDADIHYWNGSAWSSTGFSSASGSSAIQVSVGTNGNVWALDDSGQHEGVGPRGRVWTYQ